MIDRNSIESSQFPEFFQFTPVREGLNRINTKQGFLLDGAVPIGGVILFSTATAPDGYLKCDGTAVSRTTYSSLFALIGTTYGSGDGSTTFNLPNWTPAAGIYIIKW